MKLRVGDLKVPLDSSSTNLTCYTIVLDLRRCRSFKVRCSVLLRNLTWLLPYAKRRNLSEEYRDWVQRRYLTKTMWKLQWMLDHFILWIAYCVIVVFKEYVEGSKWEIPPERGDVHGKETEG